ncbi:Hypothetical protein CINCED_3A000795 [Cinara cedri]|nr:Hypothetical protein CINCED_3A000795 [Cinara cedri]
MKSLVADKLKVARILLNFGHSYLNSSSLDNSEDEEEEEDDDEKEKYKEKKEQNQQLNCKKEQMEIAEKITKNIHQNIEKETLIKFDEGVRNINEGSLKQELDDKLKSEIIDDPYINKKNKQIDNQKELYNNVNFNEIKHEFVKEESHILDKSLQQPLLNSDLKELCSTDLQKQSCTNLYLNMNGEDKSIQNDLKHKLGNDYDYDPYEIKISKCNKSRYKKMPRYRNQIKYKSKPKKKKHCVDNNVLKKNKKKKLLQFNRIVSRKFDRAKKKRLVNGIGIKSQVNPEFQPKLCKKVLVKLEKKPTIFEERVEEKLEKNNPIDLEFPKNIDEKVQKVFRIEEQNFENANEIELNLQILVNSEFDEKVQKEFVGKKPHIHEIEIQLIIEIVQELDTSVKVGYGEKQIHNKKPKEFDKEKQEVDHTFNKEIQVDLEFQDDLIKKKYTENLNEIISDYIQQLKYESGFEEEELKIEKLIDEFQEKIKEEIQQLLCVILYGEQNKSVEQCFTEKEQIELITEIQQEIKDLQREINHSIEDGDEESEKEIIEQISKTYFYSGEEKFLKNLILSLNQDYIPFYKRIEKLCNLHFPTSPKPFPMYYDEIPSKLERDISPKNDNEAFIKLNRLVKLMTGDNLYGFDKDTYIDKNDITQQKSNKETQKNIGNIQVHSEIENTINDSVVQSIGMKTNKNKTVRSFGENINYEYSSKKQETEQELQDQIENKLLDKVLTQYLYTRDLKFKNEENKKFQQHFETLKNPHEDTKPAMVGIAPETFDKIVKQDVNDCFDIVIVFNKENKKKIDGVVIQMVKGNIHVYFNEKIMKMLNDSLIYVAKNMQIFNKRVKLLDTHGVIQTLIKKKYQNFFNRLIYKIDKKIYNHTNGKITQQNYCKAREVIDKLFVETLLKNIVQEMKVDFDGQIKVKKKEQQSLNKDIHDVNKHMHLQLKFYKSIPQEVDKVTQKICESQLQSDFSSFEMDVNKLKKIFLNKSEAVEKDEQKLDRVNGVYYEELKEIMEELLNQCEKEMEEKYVTYIRKINKKLEQESEKATLENIQKVYEIVEFNQQIGKESNVEIEDSKDKSNNNFEVDIEKLDNIFHKEAIEPFNEINEVIEIVDEFEVKSDSSVEDFIITGNEHFYTKKEFSSSEEFSFLDRGLNFTKEEKVFHKKVPKKLENIKQDKYNRHTQGTVEKFKKCAKDTKHKFKREMQDKVNRELEDLNEDLQQEFEGPNSELEEKISYKLFNVQPHEMGIEDIKDLDEVPLELKIKQEQFEEELHLQFKNFQKEFYRNLKKEYDKEQHLKVNKTFNPILSNVFDEQQQTFYDLKDEFNEIKQEYKSYIQQKIFEGLQQKIDENKLLEIEEFPEKIEDEPNLSIDDIDKEFVELQRDCHDLESEFMYNVPFEFKENNLSQVLNKKPFNLFKQLSSIHKKKLCTFVDSDQWPESCLYPSSLLDCLFENPLEDKPNVLVITLYSIDVGYSIKLHINKEEPPVEAFYNYVDDTILEYIEQEQLPPHLLDLLERAEPSIFYSGCIIAEIHDQINGIPYQLYRILLRPFNMSIQSDFNQIISEHNYMNWSYNKRLKLESMLTLVSHPVMCMDSSHIAGLTVNLQHQLLSCRKIILNPLKNNFKSSKLNLSHNDLTNDFYQDTQFTSNSSNESQRVTSQLMDNTNTNKIYDLIWKFDFRIQSFKLIKLYVLAVTDIEEYSMMLLMNSKYGSVMKLRFKINLKTNKLKTYITMILGILRNKIRPDISVIRTYKGSENSTLHAIIDVPILISSNIYEPSHAEISMLINKWLGNKSEYQCYKSELKFGKIKSPILPIQLLGDIQKIYKTKKSTRPSKKIDNKINKSVHLCTTKKLSNDPNTNIEKEMSNINLREKNQQILILNKLKKESIFHRDISLLNSVVVNSLPLNSLKKPMDYHSISSSREISTSTGNQIPILDVSLNGNDINGKYDKLDSILELQSTKDILPPISRPMCITFSLTTSPPVPNYVTTISSCSRCKYILKSILNLDTLIPSVSSHIKSMLSINSNSEASITNCILLSEYLETQYDKNHVPRLKIHTVNIDTELKSVFMLLKTYYSENVKNKNINLCKKHDKQQLPSLNYGIKTETGGMFRQSLNSQCAKKIEIIKHLHRYGICLSGPKTLINSNKMPPISSLVPKTSCIKKTTTNLQLDRRKKK